MFKTKFLIPFTVIFSGIIFFFSCEESETSCNDQETKELENYRNTVLVQYGDSVKELSYPEIEQTGYFVNVSEHAAENDIIPTMDDYVIFDYNATYLNGEVYQTTYEKYKDSWAVYNQNHYDHYNFAPVKLLLSKKSPGLIAGLTRMHEGDSAILVIPSSLFMGDSECTSLVFTVRLYKVIRGNEIEEYDSLQLTRAIPPSFDLIEQGIYYHETDTAGLGKEYTDSIKINYWGYFLQENQKILFDSVTNGRNFPVNNITSYETSGLKPFSKGFSIALDTLMRSGREAEVFIDNSQAFGANGLSHKIYSYKVVPPYTSLYYKIQILE